jgi:hypothetical protein
VFSTLISEAEMKLWKILQRVGDRRNAPAEDRNGGTNAHPSAVTANLLVRSEPIYADVR